MHTIGRLPSPSRLMHTEERAVRAAGMAERAGVKTGAICYALRIWTQCAGPRSLCGPDLGRPALARFGLGREVPIIKRAAVCETYETCCAARGCSIPLRFCSRAARCTQPPAPRIFPMALPPRADGRAGCGKVETRALRQHACRRNQPP